jgi:hypothetical protein
MRRKKDEIANVKVETTRNRVSIRGAVCSGVVSFPLTMGEAKELEKLGLVRILGTW